MAAPAGKFDGKVCVVTGGNSGIGRSVVETFLAQGAKVAAVDVVDSAYPETDTFLPVKCDVTSEASISVAIRAIVAKWNTIHVLANNAGIMDKMTGVAETTPEDFSRVLAVDLVGPFLMTHHILPIMLNNTTTPKGSIVNTCSVASIRGAGAGAAYTAAKHGLLGLSRNTTWMYRNKGIKCNAVIPGGTITNIMQNSKVEVDLGKEHPLAAYLGCMPGVGQSNDVANAIVFLAGADSVSGAELAVDNGWTTA